MNTHCYIKNNQQGPTVKYREFYSIFCDNPYEKKNSEKE